MFLHYRADLRSIAMVAAALSAMGLQWSGALRSPLFFAATCSLAFIACVVNHNHQHCPTFVPPALNRIFGCLLSLATGQPAIAIVPMHNLNHHVHTSTARDHVRASLVAFRWNLLNLLAFPFIALAGYARVKQQEMARWRGAEGRVLPRLHAQLRLERAVLYSLLAVLLAARPLETLLYLLVPQLFGQWAIVAINLVQHDGCPPGRDGAHGRRAQGRDFVGRWLNWWLFNNGFHTVHHWRPGLHWSRLPELHARVRGELDLRFEHRSLAVALFKLYVWPGRRPQPVESPRTQNAPMEKGAAPT